MRDGRSLISIFHAQVAAAPSAPALVDGDDRYSYEELSAWADGVHAVLRKAGAGPGMLVGLTLRRGPAVVAAILGILKAGCGYVALDPSYPATRLEFMAADAGVVAILGEGDVPASLASVAPLIEMVPPTARDYCSENDRISPGMTAYVIYTSGSTGTPKGVPIRHANVLALLDGMSGLFSFGPADRWTLFHSYGFDFSVWEMWGAFLHGGQLVCVPDSCRIHPAAMADLLVREQVTVLNMVPSVFRHLVSSALRGAGDLGLRYVIFGGEALDRDGVAGWLAGCPGQARPEIVNMYGITETTVFTTHRRVGEADLSRTGPGTLIGSALPHLRVRLLDQDQQPVPLGEKGEIYVAGAGLARGYLNREAETRKRFVKLPEEDGQEVSYFRSGDVASYSTEHGSLIYHGRLDHQVKVSGFRIELGEIETVLRANPAVAEGVVVVEETVTGQPILVAYVALRQSAESGVPAIRRSLRQSLPPYMVPSQIRTVTALPRTASGKLDRNALQSGPERAG